MRTLVMLNDACKAKLIFKMLYNWCKHARGYHARVNTRAVCFKSNQLRYVVDLIKLLKTLNLLKAVNFYFPLLKKKNFSVAQNNNKKKKKIRTYII